jgi:hypothetical protein
MDGSTAASGAQIATATIINVEPVSSMAASSGGNTNINRTGTGRGKGKGRSRGKGNRDDADLISTISRAPKRAQNTRDMQLVVVSYMNATEGVIDDWCTATDHRKNVGMDKCLLTLIGYLEGEVCSDTSTIYKSPVPSKDVRGPFPPIPLPRSLRIGFWLAAGAEGLDPRLDHEAQNRARS